jgi:hypothetical protein
MSLINCSECNQQISDKAESCPHCGNPDLKINKSRAIFNEPSQRVQTIQLTSKRLKFYYLVSIIVFFWGLLSAFAASSNNQSMVLQSYAVFFGFIGLMVTKFLTWWHHK